MKKHIIAVAALVTLLSLTACGEAGTSEKKPEVTIVSDTVADEQITDDEAETAENADYIEELETSLETVTELETEPIDNTPYELDFPTELTDDLRDMRISVNGYIVADPCTAESFARAGWEDVPLKAHPTIESKEGWGHTHYKDGALVYAFWLNPTDSTIDLTTSEGRKNTQCARLEIDCEVIGNDSEGNEFHNDEVKLPKDIILGKATVDDVIAAYGEPDEKPEKNREYSNERTYYITYYKDNYDIKLWIHEQILIKVMIDRK